MKFKKKKRKTIPNFMVESKINFKEKIEKGDYSQSELALIFKMQKLTKKERDVIANIYNIVLGSGPTSKLFQEIREKKSYCYQINSRYELAFQVIKIQTGISWDNYLVVKQAVFKQIEAIKKGFFSLKQLNDAKRVMLNNLYLRDESPSLVINNLFKEKYLGQLQANELVKLVKETTKQDIKELAKKVELDTSFFLEGQNEKNDN